MTIADLITIARTDYLDDAVADYLWDDAFMLRAFSEAQRQACNRTDFLYEDVLITVNSTALSYPLDTRITRLIDVLFAGHQVQKVSLNELIYKRPLWRDETGMLDKQVSYVVRGNTIRFVPAPALADA
jgi:hypothetical protein